MKSTALGDEGEYLLAPGDRLLPWAAALRPRYLTYLGQHIDGDVAAVMAEEDENAAALATFIAGQPAHNSPIEKEDTTCDTPTSTGP